MTYPRFRQIAAESPTLLFELATQLASRLDRTNRKLGDLAFVDVTGRVAHAIMDLCNEPDAMTHPEGTQIKVSRQELSRLVGCSREMAGRVLKVLEEQGLLTARGKTMVVFGVRPRLKGKAAAMSAAAAPPAGSRCARPRPRWSPTTKKTTRTTTRSSPARGRGPGRLLAYTALAGPPRLRPTGAQSVAGSRCGLRCALAHRADRSA